MMKLLRKMPWITTPRRGFSFTNFGTTITSRTTSRLTERKPVSISLTDGMFSGLAE